ncbi:hypothetical protein T4A_2923 [Trichinella pseudospiralis]|uniref:Uncharacterized protein n=1 Tax=Trichinella pseudospiralis TaxID=6337 RepID=A0A0V1EP87_TRIPS|nr:hypothetical protein T4A_2923 [Trichinella pseudospiralis]
MEITHYTLFDLFPKNALSAKSKSPQTLQSLQYCNSGNGALQANFHQSNQQHRCCTCYRIGLNNSNSFVQTCAQLYSQINQLANYFAFSTLLRLFCSLFENVNNSSLTFLY